MLQKLVAFHFCSWLYPIVLFLNVTKKYRYILDLFILLKYFCLDFLTILQDQKLSQSICVSYPRV